MEQNKPKSVLQEHPFNKYIKLSPVEIIKRLSGDCSVCTFNPKHPKCRLNEICTYAGTLDDDCPSFAPMYDGYKIPAKDRRPYLKLYVEIVGNDYTSVLDEDVEYITSVISKEKVDFLRFFAESAVYLSYDEKSITTYSRPETLYHFYDRSLFYRNETEIQVSDKSTEEINEILKAERNKVFNMFLLSDYMWYSSATNELIDEYHRTAYQKYNQKK